MIVNQVGAAKKVLSPARAWIVTVLLFLLNVVNYIDKQVLSFAAIPMMEDLGLTRQQYGLLGSAFFLLFALSSILVAIFLINRIRSKTLLALLAVVWAVSQLPIAFSSSFTLILLCRILLGAGEGPALGATLNACYGFFPSERRSLPTSVVLAGATVGLMLAGPLLVPLIDTYGWRAGFLGCSFLGLLWLVAWLILGADGPYAPGKADAMLGVPQERSAGGSTIGFWLDRAVIGAFLFGMAGYWVLAFNIAWAVPYLRTELGQSSQAAGWTMVAINGAFGISLTLLAWVTERMLDKGATIRMARGVLPAICMLVGSLCFLALAQVGEGPLVRIILLSVGTALCCASIGLVAPLIADIAPPSLQGPALLVYGAVGSLGALGSPYVTGMLLSDAQGFSPAFLLCGVITALGGIAALLLLHPDRARARLGARLTKAAFSA